MPIFPLGTTLCPGADLPLQVFEPRYVRLVEDLVRGGGPMEFGVVAIQAGFEVGVGAVRALHDIGCVARIARLEPGPRSSGIVYRLLARGTRRFRLEGVDANAATPYLTGLTSPVPEHDGAPAPRLAQAATQVRDAIAAYRLLVGTPADLPADPSRLAYLVADAVTLELADRQQVLAAATTMDRLRIGRALVLRELALVRRLNAVPRVIQPGPPAPN